MQKRSKLIITKFSFFVPLVLFLLVAIYLSGTFLSGNSKRKRKAITQHMPMMVHELHTAWMEGDLDRVSTKETLECKTLLNYKNQVSEEFFQCNQLYLNCYLSDFNFKGFKALKYQSNFFEYDHLGNLIVTLNKDDDYFRMKFMNTCRDVYLPKKKYSAGSRKRQNFIWDNLDENVYIDKYYVSNYDVREWKKRLNLPLSKMEKKLPLFAPNTTLTAKEKQKYCFASNRKVLESRYFDAASYIPNKKQNPKMIKKFPYHWTKKRSVKKFDCFDVYYKGCESKRSFKFFEGLSTSWMGIDYVLGGYMEYLPNKFDATKNLKVSSFYFDEKSKWHEIGVRGELGKDNHSNSKQDIGAAFRCMALR